MENVKDIIASIERLDKEKDEEIKKLRMDNFQLQQRLREAESETERWKNIALQSK